MLAVKNRAFTAQSQEYYSRSLGTCILNKHLSGHESGDFDTGSLRASSLQTIMQGLSIRL